MKTSILQGRVRVRQERTEIDVPHLEESLTFVLPLVGPDYYSGVMGKINGKKLLRPTTAQTFSLIDFALSNSNVFQNPDEMICAEIIKRFKKDYIWTSTENISFPEGVIVYDNVDGNMPRTSLELMKLVEKQDPRARFVAKGFETRDIDLSDFLKNHYTIAQLGKDAEKIKPVVERVAQKISNNWVWVYGLDRANSDTLKYTAIDGCNGRLALGGDDYNTYKCGYVSGILNTTL